MRSGSLLLALITLALVASPSWSDSVGDWYASDPRSLAYRDMRGEIGLIFAEGGRLHLPQQLLLSKLREGEAKGVSSERLVKCLRGELGRLQLARVIVQQAGFGGSFLFPISDETLNEVAFYLRGGLSEQLVGELMTKAATGHVGAEAALAACDAIMDLRSVAPIEDSDSLQIGRLLLASGLHPSGYASLALVYGLGRSRGLSHDALVHDVIINTLSGGGGYGIMNQKIKSIPIAGPLPPPDSAVKAIKTSKGER